MTASWLVPPLLAAAPAQAGARGAPLTPQALHQQLDRFNQHAAFRLPQLSDAQLQELLDGDVVRILDRPRSDPSIRRAVGLVLSGDAAQRDLWVASQDVHFTAVDDLTELRLSRDDATGAAVWYGHVDLPSPFDDRHYVVDVWNNHALHAATDGAAWEHPWRLNPEALAAVRGRVAKGTVGGLTVADFDGSIETPINEGAWIAMALPDGRALLGYHATTVVGGNIPDGLFARYVHMGLKKLMRGVQRRAEQVIPGHYRAGHEPLPAGGPFMTPFYE